MSAENKEGERLEIHVSAAVYIADEPRLAPINQKILLIQQERGGKLVWNPPGGRIKAHEDVLRTAERETEEEIGRDVALTALIGVYTADKGENVTGIGFVFQGILLGNGPFVLNKEEGIKSYGYFSFEGVKDLLARGLIYKPEDYNRIALNDYFAGHGHSIMTISSLENKKTFENE